jgi:acyl-CoA thioesterase FadM
MSSIMTRWSVLHEHTVAPADRDATGDVTDAAVERWADAASADYLAQCTGLQARLALDGLTLTEAGDALPTGAALGRPARVVVTASVTEVFPDSFVVALRLRPLDGSTEQAFNARRTVCVVDAAGAIQDVDTAIRDELIALEHAAQHFN